MQKKTSELYHHGILGMKWGKRNGPPYPLGASDHSASEKKAGWRQSLDGGSSSGSSPKSKNAVSVKAAGHKALAKVYEINEKTYAKSNKTLSSMNKHAKEEQLRKANEAQNAANLKRSEKEIRRSTGKNSAEKALRDIGATPVKEIHNTPSVQAVAHRALAKIYEINEKTYAKSNKTLSSMNKHAKEEQLRKAEEAQRMSNSKRTSR